MLPSFHYITFERHCPSLYWNPFSSFFLSRYTIKQYFVSFFSLPLCNMIFHLSILGAFAMVFNRVLVLLYAWSTSCCWNLMGRIDDTNSYVICWCSSPLIPDGHCLRQGSDKVCEKCLYSHNEEIKDTNKMRVQPRRVTSCNEGQPAPRKCLAVLLRVLQI